MEQVFAVPENPYGDFMESGQSIPGKSAPGRTTGKLRLAAGRAKLIEFFFHRKIPWWTRSMRGFVID